MTFEQTVLHCAAPALCGIKSASLFSMPLDLACGELNKVSSWNTELCPFGKEIRVLRTAKSLVLFFVYDRQLLSRIMLNQAERLYLLQKGFPVGGGIDSVLEELFVRLSRQTCGFPHEVGLFLGYPLEDVVAFEEGRKSKYTGAWQVYGNVESAVRRMNEFRECSRFCCDLLEKGMNVPYISCNYSELKRNVLKEAC